MIDENRLLEKVNEICEEGECPPMMKAGILTTITLAVLELIQENNNKGESQA